MIKRRDELKQELVRGQAKLVDLERQCEELRNTLRRIEGAVQVLGEVIAEEQ